MPFVVDETKSRKLNKVFIKHKTKVAKPFEDKKVKMNPIKDCQQK